MLMNKMFVAAACVLAAYGVSCGSATGRGADNAQELPKVYFVREITPENLVRIYEALERPATGKVAVKLSRESLLSCIFRRR